MNNSLEKISKFSLKLLAPSSEQELYALIVREALKLLDGEYGSIVLREEGQFKRTYTTSPIPYKSKVRQKAFSYRSFINKKVIVVPVSKTIKAHPELGKLGIKSTIHIPLSYKNKSTGVLIINSKHEILLKKTDHLTLRLFGSMASLAIKKTQLDLETKSNLDSRDHFLSMAAHELRTPLTSVSGYIQLLHSRLTNKGTQESKWIEYLLNESQRLKNLVNELLVVNRLKSGKLNYSLRIKSLRDILKNVKEISHITYPDKEIIIEDKLDKILLDNVIVDQEKIIQVFLNLIENSVKYSQDTTPIKIVLEYKDSNFYISIIDKGIGIPKYEYKKIFEGYVQGSGHTREGIGLGLFLVKNILLKFNGSINVKSKVGKGTTMEVILPKAKL